MNAIACFWCPWDRALTWLNEGQPGRRTGLRPRLCFDDSHMKLFVSAKLT